MHKILYEIVAMNMEKLHRQMIRDHFLSNSHARLDEDFIEKCGWNNQDYDQETLRRVNINW
jgi:hypothetical protein